MGDNTDYLSAFRASSAGANANAAQGVPQGAGITAVKSGPPIGVDPSLAMHDPDQVRDLDTQRQQTGYLSNPAIASFAAQSPAHVAATAPDWPHLDLVSKIASDFTDPFKGFTFGGPNFGKMKDSFLGQFSPDAETRHRAAQQFGAEALNIAPADVRAVLAGITGLGNLLGRGIGVIPQSTYSQVLAARGQPQAPELTEPQKQEQNRVLGNILLGLVPLGPGGGARTIGEELGGAGGAARGGTSPPNVNGGAPFLHPETGAATFTQHGFVADEEGAAASFANKQEAARFIFQNLGDEPGEFKPFNDQNTGQWGVARTEGSAANFRPTDAAEESASTVAAMQDEISKTAFHSQAPELTEQFLSHTDVGGESAWVDPHAILDARREGHDPFPNHDAEIESAVASGREVQMPMETYLADTSGKPYEESIRNATRFGDNKASLNEAGAMTEQPKGFDLGEQAGAFVVKPNTMDLGTIANMLPTAEKFGGKFAVGRANTAFQFPTTEARDAFIAEVGKDGLAPTFEQSVGPAVERRAQPRTPESEAEFAASMSLRDSEASVRGNYELATVDTPHGAAYIVKPTEGGTEHLLEAAKRNGGRYAMGRANSAFQFRTPEARASFLREVEGPTVPGDIEPQYHQPLRELAAAVDDTVEQLFKDNGLDTLFEEPKAAGLTQRQFERYGERLEEAKAALTDRILQRTYNQIRRERTPEWKDRVAQLQSEVEKELANVSVLRAYSQLTRGKGVLGEPLEQPFRLLADDDLSKFGKDLGLPASMFRKRDGLTADQLAADLGFESGAGMIRQLTELHTEVGERSFAQFMKDTTQAVAEGRARAELGYDVSPEALMDAAREEATLPEIEDFFGSVIKELQSHVGGRPITVDDVRVQATGQFDSLPVKQASNPKVFERGIKRTGEQALRALEKDDYGAALTFRVQQLLNFQQLKLSWKFRKEFAADQKKLKRWGKSDVISGVDPLISAILQESAAEAGYEGGRDPAELQRALEEARAAGRISSLPEAINAANDQGYQLLEAPIVGDNAATPASWRDMMHMLLGVAKFGKELNEVRIGEKAWEVVALTNEVQANAGDIGRKYTPDQLLSMRDTMFGRLRGQVKSLLVNNIRPEVPLYWLDGEKQGPLMRSVVNPLQEGKYKETDLINSWIKAMREGGSSEYLAKTDKGIDAPDHMRVDTVMGPAHVLKTEGQYRTALMYLGSESARTKLLEGFGWGEEQEDWLLSRMTAEDKRYVQAFWAQNDKLFNLADEMYRRVRGYGLVKDEPRVVHLPDGTTLPGGHIHITYDPTLKVLRQIENIPGEDILRAIPAASRENPLDDEHPIRALPSAFYGLQRTGFIGPVNLDPRALAGGIAEVIHDISFREALQGAQKILFDPRVQEAMMSVLGPTYRTQMAPWLHYIAKDRVLFNPATQAAAQIIRNLSSNFVFAKVGFNLSSTIRHSSIGFMHMVREAGDPAIFAKAGQDLLTDHDHWAGFIDEMSGEVRGLMWNIDTNLQEALARDALTGGRLHDARQLGFYLFAVSKRIEGQVTWLTTYRREMAEHGNTDVAVKEGNLAVRNTQGASASVDLPTFFRKGDDFAHEIMRNTLGLLMGFRNTVPNRLWTATRLTGQAVQGKGGGGKAASIFMTYVLGAAAILALYDIFARGGGDPRKSKGDNFMEAFGWDISEQTLGSYMGLNKLEAMAHYGSDSDFSRLAEDGKKLMQGHPWGEREWGDVGKMIAGATGAITDSAINLGTAVKDVATGDIDNPVTFIQRGLLGRQGNEGGSGAPRRATRARRASRPARGGGHK